MKHSKCAIGEENATDMECMWCGAVLLQDMCLAVYCIEGLTQLVIRYCIPKLHLYVKLSLCF